MKICESEAVDKISHVELGADSNKGYKEFDPPSDLYSNGLDQLKYTINLIKVIFVLKKADQLKVYPGIVFYSFDLRVHILWSAWADSGIVDTITASSHYNTIGISLGQFCLGGHEGKRDGDKHYKDIQKVFDKLYDRNYIIMEQGESGYGPSSAIYSEYSDIKRRVIKHLPDNDESDQILKALENEEKIREDLKEMHDYLEKEREEEF